MARDILVVVGSTEDLLYVKEGLEFLEKVGVAYDLVVCHPQLSPADFYQLGQNAHKQNYKVVICGSADCPSIAGSMASLTPLPVVVIPIIKQHPVGGLDVILSALQMPEGVPVATVSTNTSMNAALLAVQILSVAHPAYTEIILAYKRKVSEDIRRQNKTAHKILEELVP